MDRLFILLLCSQGEHYNLTRGAEAEGDEAAKASGDEERLLAFLVPAVDLFACECHGTPAKERELHLMGMAAEGELSSAVRDDLPSPGGWIVFEHEDERVGGADSRLQTTPGPS